MALDPNVLANIINTKLGITDPVAQGAWVDVITEIINYFKANAVVTTTIQPGSVAATSPAPAAVSGSTIGSIT